MKKFSKMIGLKLEQEIYEQIKQTAIIEKKSVSKIIREMIYKVYPSSSIYVKPSIKEISSNQRDGSEGIPEDGGASRSPPNSDPLTSGNKES